MVHSFRVAPGLCASAKNRHRLVIDGSPPIEALGCGALSAFVLRVLRLRARLLPERVASAHAQRARGWLLGRGRQALGGKGAWGMGYGGVSTVTFDGRAGLLPIECVYGHVSLPAQALRPGPRLDARALGEPRPEARLPGTLGAAAATSVAHLVSYIDCRMRGLVHAAAYNRRCAAV